MTPDFGDSRRAWRSPLADLVVVAIVAAVLATAVAYVLVP